MEKNTPTSNHGEHSFFQNNTQLSQIPPNDTAVNRRLFGTPLNENISNRLASTPFQSSGIDTPNPYRFRFDDEEFENNLPSTEINPRKRRLNDLFGDIDDIIQEEKPAQVFYSVDEEENIKKKARSEEEQDKMLIDRILAARAELQTKNKNFLKQSKLQQLELLQKFKARNLSEVYPQWPCIPMVADHSRVYVRMHSEEFENIQLNELTLRKNYSKLLGNNSDDIWNEAQTIVEKRMTHAQSEAIRMNEIDEVFIVNDVNPNAGKLWVDKYQPKGYIDLLSDDTTNRNLLTWLKMWDKIVFGR